jgi:hypothetical protein
MASIERFPPIFALFAPCSRHYKDRDASLADSVTLVSAPAAAEPPPIDAPGDSP